MGDFPVFFVFLCGWQLPCVSPAVLTYNVHVSPFVQPVAERVRATGRPVFIEPAPYEFQRGGNQMMRII